MSIFTHDYRKIDIRVHSFKCPPHHRDMYLQARDVPSQCTTSSAPPITNLPYYLDYILVFSLKSSLIHHAVSEQKDCHLSRASL